MNAAVVVGLGILGIPVGSFLNIVIDRVPDKVSLRGPREGEMCPPIEVVGAPFQFDPSHSHNFSAPLPAKSLDGQLSPNTTQVISICY